MKILIIGKNSYIGSHLKKYLDGFGHTVDEFDIEHEDLTPEFLCGVDSIVHVAAIVHRKDITDYDLYQMVNVELPCNVAKLAKESGVKHFVFMSSMAVYSGGKSLKGRIVNDKTLCEPTTPYGKSKLEAEHSLSEITHDGDMRLACIRPANVYGKGCRGSYMSGFEKIVRKLPIIPVAYENIKQGMLYIENLCELVRLVVEARADGTYPAQDEPAVSSVELMRQIAVAIRVKRKSSRLLGIPFRILRVRPVNKLYGGIAYEHEYARTRLGDYNVVSFERGIDNTFQCSDE